MNRKLPEAAMRIFKRNQRQGSKPGGDGAIYLSGDPVPMPGNPFGPLQFVERRPLPGTTKEALESARGRVMDEAERSRSEIADLVAEDRAQVAALVAETVKKEVAATVKVEVAKTIGELRAKAAKAKGTAKSGNGNGGGSSRHRSTARSSNGRAKTAA
jgi:hypothetical protein